MTAPILSQKAAQQLLVDIENIGLPLDQISLVNLCDAKEGIYGGPGLPRRPVQAQFQKIKKLSARGYRRLLAHHNITPGPATLAAQQQDQATAQDTDEESLLVLSDDEIADEKSSDDEDAQDTDDEDIDEEDIDSDLASAFGSCTMSSPQKTPNKKLFSPSPSRASSHANDSALDALDFRRQWGTKSHPYITLADPSHPERNFPFDVISFEGVEHENHEHKGIHIRMAVASPDMNSFQAFIPSSKEFPRLALLIGRAVMVKGPSRSFGNSDAELYHEKGVECPVTKTAHEKTDTAIKAVPSRQTS
jgi:hypothetical protein